MRDQKYRVRMKSPKTTVEQTILSGRGKKISRFPGEISLGQKLN